MVVRKVMAVVLAGVVGAVVAGMLLGAVSRGLMALVAMAAGDLPQLSLAGTAGILAAYVLSMVPGGVLAAATARRRRWLLVVAGAAFLCFPAVGIAGDEIGHTGDLSTAQWVGVVAAGAGVFATIAALPLVTVRVVDRLLRRHPRRDPGVPAGLTAHTPVAPPPATSG